MNILDTKISFFRNTRDTEVAGQTTIKDVLLKFEGNDALQKRISYLRNNPDKSKEVKKSLPTFAMHGLFSYNRKKSNFIEASGVIILDIDDVKGDIQSIKLEIIESSDHVLSAMTSPSGTGIKVLYYVQPELINAENYRQIGKQISENFDYYGNVDYLSVTDCLIATYDEDILINYDAVPDLIYIENQELTQDKELEKLDTTQDLWQDAEEFFETVLYNDIVSKTNNAFHFIQVSILDLAKFGFYHPKQDLSFVVDFCNNEFSTQGDNKQRFREITEIAKNYQQTQWPYKTSSGEWDEDDEADDFIDYGARLDDEDDVVDIDDVDYTTEQEGFVDYEKLFDKVLETAREGDVVGYEISLRNFAKVFRFRGTGILTITGIPGSGKTEFTDQILIDLARLYGEESLFAGFEQSTEEHIIKLVRKMVGTNVTCPSWLNDKNMPVLKQNYDFIVENFKHIDTAKLGGNIHTILEVATSWVKERRALGKNPRYLVLDPFNMLSIKSRASGHEKIEQILRLLTQFSHQTGVMIILIAHPFKMRIDEKTGEYFVPDFYSVKGSSAFFEMSYHGLVVYRKSDGSVMVKILKVKQNNLGKTNAEVFFDYHRASGRYIPIDEEGIELDGDHYEPNWINKINKKETPNDGI